MTNHPIVVEVINTRTRVEMIDVTELVQKHVRKQSVSDGFVIVYNPHTSSAITINENADPDVKSDLLKKLDQLVPQIENYYQHDEGNSDAHVKTALLGNSVMVLIEAGRLVLGRWQGIYYCEFDGPRERRMMVKVVDLSPPSPG